MCHQKVIAETCNCYWPSLSLPSFGEFSTSFSTYNKYYLLTRLFSTCNIYSPSIFSTSIFLPDYSPSHSPFIGLPAASSWWTTLKGTAMPMSWPTSTTRSCCFNQKLSQRESFFCCRKCPCGTECDERQFLSRVNL